MSKKNRLLAFCTPALIFSSSLVFAHGSMEAPLSRIYNCYQEGPENLKSDACKA